MQSTRRACLALAGVAGGGLVLDAAAPVQSESAGADPLAWFAKRQSVRSYKPDPVPDDHLRRILDAARRAPTSGNQQPWKFLVVKDRAKIERMKNRCFELIGERIKAQAGSEFESRMESIRTRMAGYFSAPVYIVVLTDSKSTYPTYNHWDGPLAAGYLMLAARILGYGTVHITDSIPEQVTTEVLGIPERYERVCITPLGVPDAWPDPKPKKNLDDLIALETIPA